MVRKRGGKKNGDESRDTKHQVITNILTTPKVDELSSTCQCSGRGGSQIASCNRTNSGHREGKPYKRGLFL